MIRLVTKPHEETGGEMVQVWDGGVFVAGVYPHDCRRRYRARVPPGGRRQVLEG